MEKSILSLLPAIFALTSIGSSRNSNQPTFVSIGIRQIQTTQSSDDTIACDICQNCMTEPYITCAECPRPPASVHGGVRICLRCFAAGAESGTHSNSHAYSVTHDSVRVFRGSNWTAREERRLLELIERCGFGNWADVAKALGGGRTPDDCQRHYLNNYFGGIFWQMCGLTKYPYVRATTPYLYRANVTDPPRHLADSAPSKCMAGYRFARSDFDTPFDSSAELLISNLDGVDPRLDFDASVSETLNGAMVRAYNNRLR